MYSVSALLGIQLHLANSGSKTYETGQPDLLAGGGEKSAETADFVKFRLNDLASKVVQFPDIRLPILTTP
jgi:hypothetical protein